MSSSSEDQQQPTVIVATVRGSRFTHYMVQGAHLTLCARLAEYRWRLTPKGNYCRRCVSEASRRGWTVRP